MCFQCWPHARLLLLVVKLLKFMLRLVVDGETGVRPLLYSDRCLPHARPGLGDPAQSCGM